MLTSLPKGTDVTSTSSRALFDRIAHVHASDNFGKEDNHLPIGAGTVDFQKIVKGLINIGYDQTVTFEIFSRDRDYLRISREKFAGMIEAWRSNPRATKSRFERFRDSRPC